jgi:hypothetical protein
MYIFSSISLLRKAIFDGGCCTQIELMGQQTRYMDRVT